MKRSAKLKPAAEKDSRPSSEQVTGARDWLAGICVLGERKFRLAKLAHDHKQLIAAVRELPGAVKIGFESTGGQEWVFWATLVAAGMEAAQHHSQPDPCAPFCLCRTLE